MFNPQNIIRRGHFPSVAAEDDVINKYIRGGGVWGAFRRWWADIFLLSYNDPRSKHYYMSSYAMMMARAAHFHNNRSCIHPFSKFRNAWDCLTLHLLIIRMTAFHFNNSVVHSPGIFWHYLLLLVDFVFIADLYVNAKTGYDIKRTRQVILNSRDILLNYLSTNAFVDAITAIPCQGLLFLRLGKNVANAAARANLFVCIVKLISLIQSIKLVQISKYWAKDRGSFARTVAFKFLRIFAVGIIISFQILAANAAWDTIAAIHTGSINPITYHGYMIQYKYNRVFGSAEESKLFFMRFFRVCKNFFLFGYGVRPAEDPSDYVAIILTYAAAFLFHFWAGIELYNCVARDSSLNDRLHAARAQTFNVLRIRGLPDTITKKVIDYYEYKMSSLIILEKKNCLFKALPDVLTSEIQMSCYKNYVEMVPSFAKCPQEVIAKIVDLLHPEIYLVNDFISSHDGLIIVEAGLLVVYSADHQETRHLMDGDHFGEEGLITDRETSETVVAATASSVLFLDKLLFHKIMAEYPDLFCLLRMDFLLASVPRPTIPAGGPGTEQTGISPES